MFLYSNYVGFSVQPEFMVLLRMLKLVMPVPTDLMFAVGVESVLCRRL